jgi:hypothetical protein
MKVRVHKKWWQIWMPSHIDIDIDCGHDLPIKSISPESKNESTGGVAIEANEAEPWYGDSATKTSHGGGAVVTAEPPIVYASRGNAIMNERIELNKVRQ